MSGPIIRKINPAEIDVVREVLPRFRFKPLSHLPYLKRAQVECYWMDEISEAAADASSVTFVAKISDRIVGFAVYTESPWDTRVIGRRIGTLKYLAADAKDSSGWNVVEALVKETVGHAAKCGIECLTVKVHPRDTATIHALEQNGFLLMDTLVDYVFDFSGTPFDKLIAPRRISGLSTRVGTPANLPEILEIAERAFKNHFGRYNADPRMPTGAAKDVYREWARSSFSGWADWVIVADVRGKMAGYAIWKKASALETKHGLDVLHYNLVAIHPHFVGRGVFAALTYDAMRMFRQYANYLTSPTHITHSAIHRVCFELGWQISGARHSFHKWLMP
jgi:ribosomal protein S18 acetylase RimI-like enzyme/GNAT superfamily N-acetyltransferase